MEAKKTPEANLESRKGLFFQIGLVAVLFLTWGAFEWKTYERDLDGMGNVNVRMDDEDAIMTQRDLNIPPPPPPPPPPAPQEQLIIADDKEEIKEAVIQSAETSAKEVIEVKKTVAVVEEIEEIVPFAVIEDKPIFPGCEKHKNNPERAERCLQDELKKFMGKNLVYPQISQEMGIKGKVLINLIIGKDGVVRAELLRGVDKNLDAEALRVLNKLPKMTPGRQRNTPVKVSYIQPVVFTF